MTALKRTLALLCVALVQALGPAGCVPQDATHQRAPAPPPPQVQELLQRQLKLSTDPDSASSRFYFVTEVQMVQGNKILPAYSVIIGRDAGHFAMLVRYGDGMPYCYVSDSIALILNPNAEGGFLACVGGAPQYVLRRTTDGVEFLVAAKRNAKEGGLNLDLKSLIAADGPWVETAFDPATASLQMATEHALTCATLSVTDPFPVTTWSIRDDSGRIIVVRPILVDELVPVDLLGKSLDDIRRLGLPVRVVEDAAMAGYAAVPKARFLSDGPQRQAGTALGHLLGVLPHSISDAEEKGTRKSGQKPLSWGQYISEP